LKVFFLQPFISGCYATISALLGKDNHATALIKDNYYNSD